MNDSPPPPPDYRGGRVRRSALVHLLAPTLGVEKSREVIASAAKQLGVADPVSVSLDQAEALLQLLGSVEGIVGVVARFAVNRVSSLVVADDDEPTDTGIVLRPPPTEPSTGSYKSVPTIAMNELVELFATTMEAARANEVIRLAATHLGLGGGPWVRVQAMKLLDHLAGVEGIVGVVARYSQPRVLQKLSK